MKKFVTLALFLSSSVFAAEGTVETIPNMVRTDALGVYIYGDAARDIADRLSRDGIEYKRNHFGKGEMVQDGKGIRCIKQYDSSAPYCYLQIEGGAVL